MTKTLAAMTVLLASTLGCGSGDSPGADAGSDDASNLDAAPAPRWGGPEMLRAEDGRPSVAVDDAGNAIVAWIEGDGPHVIRAPRFDAATETWSDTTLIAIGDEYSLDFDLAMGANGDAIIVWVHDESPSYTVWAKRYEPGSGWTDAEPVRDPTTDSIGSASAAIDSSGNATVVWLEDAALWSRRYDSASGWGTGAQISGDELAGVPQLVLDSTGGALVVWGGNSVGAIRYTDALGWEDPEVLDDNLAGELSLTIDAADRTVAVWGYFDLNVAHHTADQGWTAVDALDMADSPAVTSVHVVVDAAGNAIAVWSNQNNANGSDVWHSRYAPNGGWTAAARIDELDADADEPVACLDGDRALVVWVQGDDAGVPTLWTRSYDATSGWSSTEPLHVDPDGLGWLDVASNTSGDAVVVWSSSGVYALRARPL